MPIKTRVGVDPSKKPPKEELHDEPSIFVDRKKIQEIVDLVSTKEPKSLSQTSDHIVRAVVQLAALNLSGKAISKALGWPLTRVNLVLQSESASREIERLQNQLYEKNCETMFKRLVPTAVENIFALMVKKSYKESTRLEAAKYIVDRALGKPKETIQQKTDMIAQVFSAMKEDPAVNAKPIEVEFEKVGTVVENTKDPLEDTLKS